MTYALLLYTFAVITAAIAAWPLNTSRFFLVHFSLALAGAAFRMVP